MLIVSGLAMWNLPRAHASQTIVNSFASLPGTPTYVCQPLGTQGNFCMGLAGDIWKDNDETDSLHDYFGADMRIIAHNATTGSSFVVSISNTYIQFPSQATDLGEFAPQTQSTSSQSPVTLSYNSLSIDLLLPAKSTTAVSSGGGGGGSLKYAWTVSDLTSDEFCLSTCRQGVLGSHADFGTIVQVPEGFSGFTVQFNAQVFVAYSCITTVDGPACYGSQYNLSANLLAPDPDFSLSGPGSVTVSACQTYSYTITATAGSNFDGTVYFSDSNLPSGFSTFFSPSSASIGQGSVGSTTYSVSVPCGVSGTFSWSVNGFTSGGTNLSHTITFSLMVWDFSISASPTSLTVPAGSVGISTVTVTSLNGFPSVVNLVADSTSCSLSPISLTGSGSSTLSCSFPAGGFVHVTVTGTSGSLSHSTTSTFSVSDFALTASPTSVTVKANAPGTSTVTVSPFNGFTGVVNLSVLSSTPTGLTCSLSQSTVTGSGTSTLICNGSVGFYSVTVLGIDGQAFSYAVITFTVQDFTISSAPSSLILPTNTGQAGSTIIVSVPSGSFTGTVNLSVTTSSSSIVATLSPASTNAPGVSAIAVSSTTLGSYIVTVTAGAGSLQHILTIPVTVQSPPPAPSFSYYPSHPLVAQAINFTATVGSSPPYTYSWNFGDGQLSSQGLSVKHAYSTSGSYTVTLTQTDSQGHVATVSQVVSAYRRPLVTSFSYTPASTVSFGQTVSFSGTASGSSSPYSYLWAFGDGSSGSGALVSHTYSSPGVYTIVLTTTSTNGDRTTNTQIIIVGEYAIFASPSPIFVGVGVGVSQGGSAISNILIQSLSGFSGTVSLQASVSPVVANGPTISLGSLSVPLSANSQGTSILNIATSGSTPFGSYTISLTSSSGSLSHSINIILKIIPSPVQFSSTATFSGVTATVTGTFTNDGPSSSLIGTVTISATNNTSGVILVSNKPTSMTLNYGSNSNVKFIMSIATSPYWLSMDCVVDIAGGTGGTCVLTRTVDVDHNGVSVDIADLATVSNSNGSTIGQQNYNPVADINGDGQVNISDVATVSYYCHAYEYLP